MRFKSAYALPREIIADASVKALENISEQNLQQLAENNPTLFKRIRNFVNEWVSKVREKLHKAFNSGKSETNRFAEAMQDSVNEMAAKWNRLLLSAAENVNSSETQNTDTQTQESNTEQQTQIEVQRNKQGELFLPYRHIDQRTLDSVKTDDVQLFSQEVEIARMYYSYAAELLQYDLGLSEPGQRFFIDRS